MGKVAVIYGGGTMFHIRPHLALCAPAYGRAAVTLEAWLQKLGWETDLRLTTMAGGDIETNDDLAEDIRRAINEEQTGMIVMTAAICDFKATGISTGKNKPRLESKEDHTIRLTQARKLIKNIRSNRKDIFLVGFKTTTNATVEEQFDKALRLLKSASCNLVLANDVVHRNNMIVTPEMACYGLTEDRGEAMRILAEMATHRSGLTFTRTEVKAPAKILCWEDVPEALRRVVDHCVANGAYKPFNGVTVGHFGWLAEPNVLYSSRRKHNYNNVVDRGLVRVEFSGSGSKVVAHGYKPSAGVRSQYELLDTEHDCVVHFHCPLKQGKQWSTRPQQQFECGSLECGRNTASGMKMVDHGIKAVMLDQHGPNIVFHHSVDPQKVIRFIEEHFDLNRHAGAPLRDMVPSDRADP